jgi:DNA-binding response OmpR family regulator
MMAAGLQREVVLVVGSAATTEALRRGGIDCVSVTTRRDALEACARHSPQLAIVSFFIVRLGLTASQLVDAGAHQAIAVLDGPSAIDSLAAYRAGFDLCLHAPVVPRDIERMRTHWTVRRAVARHAIAELPWVRRRASAAGAGAEP